MSATPFREHALLLGPRRSLVGVVTESAASAAGERPTVVLLNSGIVHRVGANRMTVVLARVLAGAGYHVVRFDLSGIGDSEPREDGLEPFEAALADVREVLDALEATRGARRFVLGGLCSGADHSLFSARQDRRVVGAILLDPSVPRTFRHYVHHFSARALRGESWLNVLRGANPQLRSLRARLGRLTRSEPPPVRERSVQEADVRTAFEGAYRTAVARGVQFMAVLTGERSYYRGQLRDAFRRVGFGDRLHVEYLKSSDHMFSAESERRRVITAILEWVQRTDFADAPAPPDATPVPRRAGAAR